MGKLEQESSKKTGAPVLVRELRKALVDALSIVRLFQAGGKPSNLSTKVLRLESIALNSGPITDFTDPASAREKLDALRDGLAVLIGRLEVAAPAWAERVSSIDMPVMHSAIKDAHALLATGRLPERGVAGETVLS